LLKQISLSLDIDTIGYFKKKAAETKRLAKKLLK